MLRITLVLVISSVALSRGDPSTDYGCICPGIKRTVCQYGPSGNSIRYDNLCVAQCSAKHSGNAVSIGKRLECDDQSGQPDIPKYGNEKNSNYVSEEWFRGVKKEAEVWRRVNSLMAKLIKLSNGGGPRCVCPSFQRKICIVGHAGNVETYDNLCTLLCTVAQVPNKAIGIGNFCNPSTQYNGKRSVFDEEKELNDWIQFMESEISFYRKVDDAMSGFFS